MVSKVRVEQKNPWSYIHDFIFDCSVNDGLMNASLKNQTTLINQRKGSNANPPRKCDA